MRKISIETISFRKKILDEANECQNISSLCSKYDISRSTFYKWKRRFLESNNNFFALKNQAPVVKKHPFELKNNVKLFMQNLVSENPLIGIKPLYKKVREKFKRNFKSATLRKHLKRMELYYNYNRLVFIKGYLIQHPESYILYQKGKYEKFFFGKIIPSEDNEKKFNKEFLFAFLAAYKKAILEKNLSERHHQIYTDLLCFLFHKNAAWDLNPKELREAFLRFTIDPKLLRR